MFRVHRRQSMAAAALTVASLIYHSAVRSVRKGHSNALMGLLSNILQTLIFVAVFYIMFSVLGLRGNAIRGDFILYIMSGIFMFMTNTRSMGAVAKSEGPTSAMMLHAPMNTTIAIGSAALAALYTQSLSIIVILGIYHLGWGPVEIYDPIGLMAMFLLAWANGVAIGMLVLAVRPWWPGLAGTASTIYSRVNMIASGKMFVANMLPMHILVMFSWNPLFHIIDQARGFAFINYNPHFSSVSQPVIVTAVLAVIGLMAEFFTRRRVSASWSAGR
ncbi:ABC transporter permease [Albidovulum sp.]